MTGASRDALADQVLHVQIGPVQAFINQGRRTRDLWAGSFLLSWLSGCAMAEAVGENVDQLTFPKLKKSDGNLDAFYADILKYKLNLGDVNAEGESWRPTLPNHFRATRQEVWDAASIAATVQANWVALASKVWDEFVDPGLDEAIREKAREVWNRQIGKANASSPFWDVVWASGVEPKDKSDLSWLDQRKSLRLPTSVAGEPGEHCMLMEGWQELSGQLGYKNESRTQFWAQIRQNIANYKYGPGANSDILDLGKSERLCAIALVRRLFPLLSTGALNATIGWVPGGIKTAKPETKKPESECREIRYWPSTSYMAAVRWLETAHNTAPDTLAFLGKAVDVFSINDPSFNRLKLAERYTSSMIKSVKDMGSVAHSVAHCDGSLFFKKDLDRAELFETPPAKLKSALGSVYDARFEDGTRLGGPSSYYAVLAMDGDRIGKRMREDPNDTSAKLAEYVENARKVLEDNSAVTIFAGGDDLLAMCAVDDALPCAVQLEAVWRSVFGTDKDDPTISAGIAYAHRRTVLRWVLEMARSTLLDGWAKSRMGRGSVAAAIMRPGGHGGLWVSPWRRTIGDETYSLVSDFCGLAHGQGEAENFRTTAFIYKAMADLRWHLAAEEADLRVELERANTGSLPGPIFSIEDEVLAGLVANAAGSNDLETAIKLVRAARAFPSDADREAPQCSGPSNAYVKSRLQAGAFRLLAFLNRECRPCKPAQVKPEVKEAEMAG